MFHFRRGESLAGLHSVRTLAPRRTPRARWRKFRAASDEDFFHRAAYILEFADGDEFDEIHAVNALKAYLEQRQAWAARLVSR